MAKTAFSDLRLQASIAPHSLQWPSPDDGAVWRDLHEAVDDLRSALRGADSAIAAVADDPDLSDTGRTRRVHEIGLQAISEIEKIKSVSKARQQVDLVLQKVAERIGRAVQAPTSAHEIQIQAAVRDYIAALPSKADFLAKRSDDPQVASAVLNAPPYLTGLSDQEYVHFKDRVAKTQVPEDVALREKLTAAMEAVEKGQRAAVAMAAERGQLQRTAEGWAPKGPSSEQAA